MIYLLIIVLLVLIVYFIFFVAQFYNVFFKGYAPFISTDSETIKTFLGEVTVNEPIIIYELGCGRARFLRIAEKIFSKSKFIGIENLLSLYLINKLRLFLQFSKIKLLKQNFFDTDLRDAGLIYCYLNNLTMKNLGEKFKRECKQGTQIISRSFPIPQLVPVKTLVVKHKKIYLYQI